MMLVSLLLCLLFSAQGAGTEKMITIDGGKEPQKVPEWAAWESAFDTLSLVKRKDLKGFDDSLMMPEADKQLVYAEALEQTSRRQRLVTKVKALDALAKAESFMDLHRKSWDMNFEYRQEILDASERLLNRLSPDGRAAMLRWVEEVRKSIKLTMPESHLADFQRPR